MSKFLLCALSLCASQLTYAQGMRLSSSPLLSLPSSTSGADGSEPKVIKADFIVAIVNSEPITNNEIRNRLFRYERRLAEQGTTMPSRIDLQREILEDIIREKLQLKLAKDSGIRMDDRTIEAALQNFAAQNNTTLAELKTRTSTDGIGYPQIRADVQNQLLIQKLRERDVLNNINISENEVDLFITEQLASEQSGEASINLAQILIAIPDIASPLQLQALQDRANRILTRAKAGEDFFKLAQENSDSKDAVAGGQMGLKPIDRYPTLFSDATKDSKEGDLLGLIRSGAGFHILKVLAKQTAGSTAMSITQTRARHILLRTSPAQTEAAAKTKLFALKNRIETRDISFAAAATEISQDGSAAAGGDLGWVNPGQFVAEFEDAMGLLAVGKVSPPVVTRFGVHLILVEERRQGTLSTTEQRDMAKNVLREKKFDDAYSNWIRELRANAYVEYRELQ